MSAAMTRFVSFFDIVAAAFSAARSAAANRRPTKSALRTLGADANDLPKFI